MNRSFQLKCDKLNEIKDKTYDKLNKKYSFNNQRNFKSDEILNTHKFLKKTD